MKGIILAGGSGTRLFPLTKSISKQIIPVYDKPMIYYPLSTLMLSEIKDILIISSPEHLCFYKDLLGDGKQLGLNLNYAVQPAPDGIAQAFIIGENFIGNDPVCLILGDNIFYGHSLGKTLTEASALTSGAIVFGYYVNDPERYGVVEFDSRGKVMSLEEKPHHPKSSYAVTGLYFYDNTVVQKAKTLAPSARGELEITDLNKLYLSENKLSVKVFGRGMAWLDTGTHESLLQASLYIHTIEKRQGLKISCIEEIAYKKSLITKDQLLKLADELGKSQYGDYLKKIANEEIFTFLTVKNESSKDRHQGITGC